MTAERFPVEAGHIMMFARAIGDYNPVYHDAQSPAARTMGGVIAPPTFVQSVAHYDPDYPLRPRPGVPWFGSGAPSRPRGPAAAPPEGERSAGRGSGGGGSGGTGLHAEQHYEYHRPLRAGETLTITTRPGQSWEKTGRRGGQLHFMESVTEYRGADGELVVTARSVGVRTSQTVEAPS
jgi:hypothetical protein